jgi:hypothetical protein
MKTRPAQIVASADGSGYVKDIAWSGWGQPTAVGTGIMEINNCSPNCAQGTFTGYPAKVTLSGLSPYGLTSEAYSIMVISVPTSPYGEKYAYTNLTP